MLGFTTGDGFLNQSYQREPMDVRQRVQYSELAGEGVSKSKLIARHRKTRTTAIRPVDATRERTSEVMGDDKTRTSLV